MARISVEQKALTDSRFTQLGMSLVPDSWSTPGYFMHALGLGVMIHVWNECQERSTHSLHVLDLEAIGLHLGLSSVKLSSSIVMSELGKWNADETRVRIRGTKGRIEWLQKRRDDGKKGGRPRKTLGLARGLYKKRPGNNPPTPALTPAPTKNSEEETTLAPSFANDANSTPPVLTFPTNGSGPKSWDLTSEQVVVWMGLFPGIEVESECRKALAWIQVHHPKTARGMPKFLVGWLSRANDHHSAHRKETVQEHNERAGREWMASKGFS